MIVLSNVSKSYGKRKVLKNVSFTANKGEVTCLLGINGVGKSTTLKAIMGLTTIDAGTIEVDGEKVKEKVYEKIAFIPDKQTMYHGMTIGEAIDYMEDFYDEWDREKAEEIIAFFKLREDMRIHELSNGNAAKVNLMLGLAQKADYLLMDEPFSGIDVFSREQIRDVFTSNLLDDQGVIVTTHEVAEFEHLIDKVILLEQGTIVKEFYTEEMREKEGKSVVDVMREVYCP